MSDLLRASEAGKLIGVSESEMESLAAQGRVACYRFGSQTRFDAKDVLAAGPFVNQLRSARVLREGERLRLLVPEANRPACTLTAEELAIAQKRARRQRMPPWASGKAIRAVYAEAKRLTKATGVPHHVDHEIPLQGEFVSGLHVESNLRVLTASENLKKRNRYEV